MKDDQRRITSFQNAKVKQIKRLRDKRGRQREGRFVIDNERDLIRALACGYEVDYLLYAPQNAPGQDGLPDGIAADVIYETTPDILDKAGYRENPSAVVAVMASPPPLSLSALQVDANPFLLVLVGLEKPGNIGALMRTADAAGVSAILLVDVALDRYNPNIIRSSTGACFLNNIYNADSETAIAFLRENQCRIAATLIGGDVDLFQADFSGRLALVMGQEDIGLDATWSACADQRLMIPMVGEVSDSLNVSVSGAICMYEALRQRRDKL